MDKRILAIFDSEEGYAYRLMEFISGKTNLPFEIYVFTKENKFYSCAKNQDIECLLISESVYKKEVDTLKIPHIIILSESGENLNKTLHHVNKYQSCENIFHQIIEYYTNHSENIPSVIGTNMKNMEVIGIYTPVGRCLQTTFSLTLGQMLARGNKVLYLNFEIYSGLSKMLCRNFNNDLSDLMYYFSCAREKLLYRLESMVETVNGLDFIPPTEIYQNLADIKGEQWLDLFQEIERTGKYDYLILDLTDGVMDLWEVLRGCDYVYTIAREDGLSIAKIEQYEKVLNKVGYGDINAKTIKWKLPIFKQLPVRFEELTYGELATYIKLNVFPELFKEGDIDCE